MKTILITGSTQGLGLQIVGYLAMKQDVNIVMAVRNIDKGNRIALTLGKNVTVVKLDLSSLRNVQEFIRQWDLPLDGLINNAGVQFTTKNSFTADGFEETIAVNHLAAFLLTVGLMKHLKNSRVLFIGSGTHDPHHPVAKRFGFRGARYTSIEELAQGLGDSSDIARLNNDRYATSKFLNTITAVELARRYKEFSSFTLDPGMMPGTGLARDRNALIRFLWRTLMPAAALFMPDTSTVRRSGRTAAWIMTESRLPFRSGAVISYDRKPCRHVWEEMVLDKKIGKEVFEDTLAFVRPFM